MPRILILGATGTIGTALSASLLRANHKVYGLARTPTKATQLARLEIIPVLGSDQDSTAYIQLIKEAHIDVVVDCAGANMGSRKILDDVREAGRERLEREGEGGGGKLGFVYTSGMWVHGSSSRGEPCSDLDPVGSEESKAQPPRLVAWRPQLERDVLGARDVLDTVVVRPALVYGREHAIWSSFFGPVVKAAKGASHDDDDRIVRLPLDPECRWGLVHVDDVAEGLRCAVEKLPLISGTGVYPVFDLMTSHELTRDVVESFAEKVGLEGKGRVEYVKAEEDDLFAEAMQTSRVGDSSRAEQLLGWVPRKRGFVAGMDVYAKAFVAAQE